MKSTTVKGEQKTTKHHKQNKALGNLDEKYLLKMKVKSMTKKMKVSNE